MPCSVILDREELWPEVIIGNTYALFMGYMSMAVKGLGLLVLTWTTVVLLGGFVSTLQKKDFWCLTFITFVQTAGIFDVLLAEKLSYIWDSIFGIAIAGHFLLSSNPFGLKCECLVSILSLVPILLFGIVLCPLAAVYIFGLYISAGISVWRLRQRDYRSDADGLGNLEPALDVVYSLALLQGVIFCCKYIFGFAQGHIVNEVQRARHFKGQYNVGVSDYLLETMNGCEKDPSFARGRNLITYAVDLMGSKSTDDYLSGVKILDAFAELMEKTSRMWEEERVAVNPQVLKGFMPERIILIKHLIMSASSTDILQKLVQTLGLKSIYNRETRERAARIVANIFATDIHLEEFPRWICHISSLIDTFEEYRLLQPYQRDSLYEIYEQDWFKVGFAKYQGWFHEDSDPVLQDTYKELMVQGFRILRKLAANGYNCRVMLHTPCLLRKIMAPVTSDLLHHIDHGAWSSIVEGSLRVMAHLMAATGQTGNKLRREISSSNEAINTMERILECDKCDVKLQKQVILILKQLYEDTSLVTAAASKERFIEMLVKILIDDSKDNEARREEAAITLVAISYKTEKAATVIMKANENAVDNLTAMLFQKDKWRITAAQILEYLCIHYTNNDESLRKLQKAMINAVPKLLEELSSALEEPHIGIEVDQDRFMKPKTDVENQCGDSQENGQGNNSSSNYQQYLKLNKDKVVCILSVCVTLCDTLISADQHLAHQFHTTAPRDGALSFPMKLKEFVKVNMETRADCLETMKLTSKMVISMIKHRGTYVKQDMESLMDTLCTASKEMSLLDGSMVFGVTHGDVATLKPFRSLASLVKEAKELVEKHYGIPG